MKKCILHEIQGGKMGIITLKEMYHLSIYLLAIISFAGCSSIIKNSLETVKLTNRSPDGNNYLDNKLKNSYYRREFY